MKCWIIFEAFRFCYELRASGGAFRTVLESIPTPEGLRTFAQWRKCQRTMHQVRNHLQIQTNSFGLLLSSIIGAAKFRKFAKILLMLSEFIL